MRRMTPSACRRCNRASVAPGVRPRRLPSQAHGSSTSGRPACVSWIRRLASEASDGEMQADMVSLFFGQIEDFQPRAPLGALDGGADLVALPRFAGRFV